jgi:hypothetical protein
MEVRRPVDKKDNNGVNQEPIQLKGRGEEDKSTKETQKEHPDR